MRSKIQAGQYLPSHVPFLQAVIPALQANVAIVGLNQVYDVEIDKVSQSNSTHGLVHG
jgi:4-hydroxybenzoate polyprenyltransferase